MVQVHSEVATFEAHIELRWQEVEQQIEIAWFQRLQRVHNKKKERIVMPLQAEVAQQQICDGSVRMVMMSTSKDSCCTTEMIWFDLSLQTLILQMQKLN
jgi:exopolyphosphatase/pppGpp-phosphohydrolase